MRRVATTPTPATHAAVGPADETRGREGGRKGELWARGNTVQYASAGAICAPHSSRRTELLARYDETVKKICNPSDGRGAMQDDGANVRVVSWSHCRMWQASGGDFIILHLFAMLNPLESSGRWQARLELLGVCFSSDGNQLASQHSPHLHSEKFIHTVEFILSKPSRAHTHRKRECVRVRACARSHARVREDRGRAQNGQWAVGEGQH
jgi:hypothetical protein